MALEIVVMRMVHLPAMRPTPLPHIPMHSLIALAVMSAVAAGIPEEVGFRGYVQVPLERRYGSVFGVLFVAFVFALAQLNHGLSIFLPFDFLFGVVFGILAYRANSLLPGAVLHSAFDVILFVAGRRIAAALSAKPVIWSSGSDVCFWVWLVTFVLLGARAVCLSSPCPRNAEPAGREWTTTSLVNNSQRFIVHSVREERQLAKSVLRAYGLGAT